MKLPEIEKLADLYERRKEERENKLRLFFLEKTQPFLVIQSPPGNIWGRCNSIEEIYRNNLVYFYDYLMNDYTDDLPYLEPWMGVGVYASAFGCEYLWREDNAPDTYYRYHHLEEIKNISYPEWRSSPVMKQIVDCIVYFNEHTRGKLPIVFTDTQSPFDTATLILETTEFFTGCYTDPGVICNFLQLITNLIIEFSNIQQSLAGECRVYPGHIFPSMRWLKGIAVSDDNVAVSSVDINETIAMPFLQQLSDSFGGIAIHSCGNWSLTMNVYKQIKGLFMIDCAVDEACDPNPNDPVAVRNALAGSGIIAKVRMGKNLDKIAHILEKLVCKDLQLIVQLDYDEQHHADLYQHTVNLLEELYEKNS